MTTGVGVMPTPMQGLFKERTPRNPSTFFLSVNKSPQPAPLTCATTTMCKECLKGIPEIVEIRRMLIIKTYYQWSINLILWSSIFFYILLICLQLFFLVTLFIYVDERKEGVKLSVSIPGGCFCAHPCDIHTPGLIRVPFQ